ncbi:hypothetical protein GCM10008955_01740 [Deinococcus malanensis]|uniref:Uncharacterized protein n=1 Tax=Deinococcus malanensis TaxID=1706855 RepID=A0ABQ2EHV6_9DEIO|nr:hypothetical protein GCM10008955_01740 [Deinococcus malanensis]
MYRETQSRSRLRQDPGLWHRLNPHSGNGSLAATDPRQGGLCVRLRESFQRADRLTLGGLYSLGMLGNPRYRAPRGHDPLHL